MVSNYCRLCPTHVTQHRKTCIRVDLLQTSYLFWLVTNFTLWLTFVVPKHAQRGPSASVSGSSPAAPLWSQACCTTSPASPCCLLIALVACSSRTGVPAPLAAFVVALSVADFLLFPLL